MKLSDELIARGFINQFSAETLAEIIDGPKRTVYLGIDPSADSAHAGNFVTWMLLRHLAQHGHQVIFLVGGGTGMIGDPKPDVERTLAAPEEVAARVAKLKAQAEHIMGGGDITFVNNYDWLSHVDLITFLRDIGKHFTVNDLIKKDAIATRLQSEVGLSYTEFAYPLLQAYDYLTLHRLYGCDVQIGGSDQWGNIIAGVDLIRRTEQKTAYAVTVALITDKATGKKFGKSEGNAVWLDAEKTSPFSFYQFWFNVNDESVLDYLKLFTFMELGAIESLANGVAVNPGARVAQKRLAFEVTSLVHGSATATAVAHVSEALFGELALSSLTPEEVQLLEANAPLAEVASGTSVVEVVVQAGLATSKREARTFIESGAVSLDNEKITTVDSVVDGVSGSLKLLRRGKKQLSLLKVV